MSDTPKSHPPLTPAEVLRLLSEKRKDPALYRKYQRTEHWGRLCEMAENEWRLVLGVKLMTPLECICGCGRKADQWHHTSAAYGKLFAEDPIKHLRPYAAICHRKLHAGRKR